MVFEQKDTHTKISGANIKWQDAPERIDMPKRTVRTDDGKGKRFKELSLRKVWDDIFEILKGKKSQPRILDLAKLSFRDEGERDCPEQKLRELHHH